MKGPSVRTSKLLAVAALAAIAGCTTPAPDPGADEAAFKQMMASSFRDKGIARVERLQQDESDAACSRAEGAPLPEAQALAIRDQNRATVKMPADGRFLGDWRAGEKLAQNGKGMSWSDASTATRENGGSCYNCHQIGPQEIAYGTIGPSLTHYLANHEASDPRGAAARRLVQATWIRLYNAKALNACSVMPRFGHAGLLDEKQLKDLMA
ncbi:MAG: sulfur oxidation c-type cytochrome SoxX, partial [Burkholderiales bacterium]|nr:sulfur oxidation c-type cytochrome SoxX [Burkholderiales bacterium]